jgi:hypothetical protein
MKINHQARRNTDLIEDVLQYSKLGVTTLHDNNCVISVLDNRERVLRSLGKRRVKIANFIFLVNSTLKKVSSNGKRRGESGSPCLTPRIHLKSFPVVPFKSTEEVPELRSSLIHMIHF